MSFALLPLAALILSPTITTTETLTVFAAASLKDAFTTIATRFEKDHPGATVALNFAGSQTLAAQIVHGAPADVFASASKKNMEDAKPDQGMVRVFATNRLTIVVRKGLSGVKDVKSFASVPKIVLADVSVPAGKYGEEFLSKCGKKFGESWVKKVNSHVVSREMDVRSVLAKVVLGEADAGIVYVSDAVSAKGRVLAVSIPDGLGVLAEYTVAVMPRTQHRRAAQAFVDSLFTAGSRKTLSDNGFLPPIRKAASQVVKTTVRKPE